MSGNNPAHQPTMTYRPVTWSGVQMTPSFADVLLKDEKVPQNVVDALKAAMLHSDCDVQAHAYADAMARSYIEYRLPGVKTQVAYMIYNMRNWQGQEARDAKKILKKWSQEA